MAVDDIRDRSAMLFSLLSHSLFPKYSYYCAVSGMEMSSGSQKVQGTLFGVIA